MGKTGLQVYVSRTGEIVALSRCVAMRVFIEQPTCCDVPSRSSSKAQPRCKCPAQTFKRTAIYFDVQLVIKGAASHLLIRRHNYIVAGLDTMHFARTPLKVDASTAVTIVFGILGAILTILGVYFTFKQLQLAASRVQTQIDVGHSTNNVLGL